jgi:serine/threonine protein phosphatase PrpC
MTPTSAPIAQLSGSSGSAQGRRPANEDSCLLAAYDGGHYAVVADGMGGGVDGARFSRTAVEQFSAALQQFPLLNRHALQVAVDQVIEDVARLRNTNPAYQRSGTTFVAALVLPQSGGAAVHLANIGDSRAYLVTLSGPAQQLTYDHTFAAQLAADGVPQHEADAHPQGAHLTHVLGDGQPAARIPFCFTDLQLMYDEQLVLCSDGVARVLSPLNIAEIVRSRPAEQAAEALVSAALTGGSQDNVTAVVVRAAAGRSTHPTAVFPLPAAAEPAITAALPAAAPPHSSRKWTLALLALAIITALIGVALLWYAAVILQLPHALLPYRADLG